MHICIHLIHFYAAMLLCFSSCSWYTFVNLLLFTSFIIPEGGRVRRGTSAFGSRPLHGLPPPSSRSPIAPCLHQVAVTSPAPCAITPGTLNLMLPRNRRSLIPPCRPSTSPRLQRKMAAHFPPLSKQSACRGQRRKNEHGALTNALWSHFSSSHHRSVVFLLLCSDVGMCRICHEGAGGETLLSPCDCTGTLGKVHKSCLEKWLSSSNTSYCELCHTEFTIERRPQPLTQVSRAVDSRVCST